MITRFQATGVRAGIVNSSYELRIPTMTPERPSRATIGKRTRERPIARSSSYPKRRMTSGAARMKAAVRAVSASSSSQKTVEATRQARAALALLEQLAEDGDERARERRVRDERADEVRHLERDRKGIDPGALDAEVTARDDLADESQHA